MTNYQLAEAAREYMKQREAYRVAGEEQARLFDVLVKELKARGESVVVDGVLFKGVITDDTTELVTQPVTILGGTR